MSKKIYGAYTHARPDGRIFYVGKGDKYRAKLLTPKSRSKNQHHKHIVAKYGAENIVVVFIPCATEELAFRLECELIAHYRKHGTELCNHTSGGEGVSGAKHSDKSRKLLSEKAKLQFSDPAQRELQRINKKALWNDPEYRAKNSAGNKLRAQNPETRRKVVAGSIGRKQPMDEVARRAAAVRQAYIDRPELREKMSRIVKEARWTPEAKQVASKQMTERMKSPAVRLAASMRVSQLVWVTNDIINRRVTVSMLQDMTYQGWHRGRVKRILD